MTETLRTPRAEDFPHDVEYRGLTWTRTGKVGTDAQTGAFAAEYSSWEAPGERLWVDAAGEVTED
jgi:hypothetical protein